MVVGKVHLISFIAAVDKTKKAIYHIVYIQYVAEVTHILLLIKSGG